MAALVILVGGFLVSRAFKEKEVSVPEKTSPQTLEEFAKKRDSLWMRILQSF